jgi:hypothetical protein
VLWRSYRCKISRGSPEVLSLLGGDLGDMKEGEWFSQS